MDTMEKELERRYGNSIIPAGETRAVLERAYSLNLMERGDVCDLGDTSPSNMLRYISEMRRKYLLNDNTITFSNEEHKYQQAHHASPGDDPHFIDKTLEAYFEYAKMTDVPVKKGNSSILMRIIVILFVLLPIYISYTPTPY